MKGFLIFLLVMGAAGFGGWKYWQQHEAERRWESIVMPDRMARVLQPQTPEKLAELLQRSGKIRDTSAFIQAAREIGLKKVASGGYALPKMASPRELAKIFSQTPDYAKITFPEGWTGLKMAARLAANGFVHANDFRNLIYPPGKDVSPWEGRLFPETYNLPRHGQAREIVNTLNKRFNNVMKGFPLSQKKLPRGADGKPLSQLEIVTLASLVERESSDATERPLIAGVLLNRLHKKMRLQCDASIQYVLEIKAARGEITRGHKEKLTTDDLRIDSPYNTYRHAGLPPAPICNPGKSSLLAALQPRPSKFFYYVTSPKLKRHLFATTFEEHQKNRVLASN